MKHRQFLLISHKFNPFKCLPETETETSASSCSCGFSFICSALVLCWVSAGPHPANGRTSLLLRPEATISSRQEQEGEASPATTRPIFPGFDGLIPGGFKGSGLYSRVSGLQDCVDGRLGLLEMKRLGWTSGQCVCLREHSSGLEAV